MTVMGVITSEDIFMKAAIEYCRRTGIDDPFKYMMEFDGTAAQYYREQLADLSEKINSLKSVGAI